MRRLAAAVVLAAVLAGCGGDDGRDELARRVQQVRDAAESGDVAAATGQLSDLRADVRRQLDEGDLDQDEADQILEAITRVEQALAPTTTTTTTVPPPPPDDDDEEDRGDGKGKDKDEKKGDDD